MLAWRIAAAGRPVVRAWAWSICFALIAGGCANFRLPRIDPSGDRLFVWPSNAPPAEPGIYPPQGAPPLAPDSGPAQGGISISPSQIIAPVGSEVVMVAGVSAGDAALLGNERVEWTLAPDGVGQFVSPGERGPLEVLHWLHGLPKKVDSRYVINTTLTGPVTLDRGTPTPADDILVQPGQAWVTVSSPTEGTSHVTVFARAVAGWDKRQQTASIYWVDGQWRFPPPAISPAGTRQNLVTMLTRQSDNAPLAGWTVRYEISGGPEAGFSPDGATSVEVTASPSGEASAEIFQKQPVAGTNQIQIQVIRPAAPGDQNRALPIGSGSTQQTWTLTEPVTGSNPPPVAAPAGAPAATAQLEVTVNGPSTATVGSDVQFEVQVVNRGPGAATRVLVTDRFGDGLQHAVSASPMEHDLVDLPPGTTGRLLVAFRVTRAGETCQDITVTADGAAPASARRCLTASEAPQQVPATMPPVQTTESPPATTPPTNTGPLSVRKVGPDRQRVGEAARFRIEVTNTSNQSINDLEIADNFETSLQPAHATDGYTWLKGNSLGWKIASLDAGKTTVREIEFTCLRQTPRACNRVTVTAAGIDPIADEACLEVLGQPGDAAAATPPLGDLQVAVADTADPIKAGGETTYQVLVSNAGTQSAFDVVVTATLGSDLKLLGLSAPVEASVLVESVKFQAIRELRAGENPLSFELRVQGVRPATARFHVDVTSRGQTKPASAEQTTEILAAD
jgi:uncharacterized repeat protein (TIGR01451 family)